VDLNKDGTLEAVVGFGGGYVSAYNLTTGGIFYPNFPYNPGFSDEFRSLAVADINQDGGAEIIVPNSSRFNKTKINERSANGRGNVTNEKSREEDDRREREIANNNLFLFQLAW